MQPISERIVQPTPVDVRSAREAAGLTQTQAAALVSPARVASYKTWSAYELEDGNPNRRSIPLAVWELFLLMTGQHPSMRLIMQPSKSSS